MVFLTVALAFLQGPHGVLSLCSGHPSHKVLDGGGTNLSPLLTHRSSVVNTKHT